MRDVVSATGCFIAGLFLGGLAIYNLPPRLNEPSIYKVHAAEKCIPEHGVALLLNYNGRGTTHITVLPPEEAPKAASKEKK